MRNAISVERILARVPERARTAYTNFLTHADTRVDFESGWCYAYCTQNQLARDMGCSLATVKRAVLDLRRVGVLRVLAWPGAYSETHLRMGDVAVDSVFGPVQKRLDSLPAERLEEEAITRLLRYWDDFERNFAHQSGAARGGAGN